MFSHYIFWKIFCILVGVKAFGWPLFYNETTSQQPQLQDLEQTEINVKGVKNFDSNISSNMVSYVN